jgi:hypothetical protein
MNYLQNKMFIFNKLIVDEKVNRCFIAHWLLGMLLSVNINHVSSFL